MITDEEPYYMKNEKWYKSVFDIENGDIGIDLTEEGKKDPEVVKSYVEYMALFGIKLDKNYNRIKDE